VRLDRECHQLLKTSEGHLKVAARAYWLT